jgi:hypothetical protein
MFNHPFLRQISDSTFVHCLSSMYEYLSNETKRKVLKIPIPTIPTIFGNHIRHISYKHCLSATHKRSVLQYKLVYPAHQVGKLCRIKQSSGYWNAISDVYLSVHSSLIAGLYYLICRLLTYPVLPVALYSPFLHIWRNTVHTVSKKQYSKTYIHLSLSLLFDNVNLLRYLFFGGPG